MIAAVYGLQAWLSDWLGDAPWIPGAYMLALMLIGVVPAVLRVRRLKILGLPPHYVRMVAVARTGTLLAVGMLLWDLFQELLSLREMTSSLPQRST